MARLIACATGNLTSSSTWQVADTTMVIDSEAGTLSITTNSTTHTSPNSTPGAITVDGIAVKIAATVASPTGTFSVKLRNTTASSDVISVSVNVADMPIGISGESTGWCFFKFASPQTLLAATNYAINAVCSVANEVSLFRSTASSQEFCRLLRTTTNAAPAAGDQMIITKEYTNVSASNSITVTMDNTASTTFGSTTYVDSVSVSGGGVLTWGTSASTNYQLKVAGLVSVWAGSTWNQGTSGTRIPSTSTARLIFSVATNVDSGFNTVGTAVVNRYGNIISNDATLMTTSIGGYCTSSGTAVTGVTGQSFVGLTGTIVINGSSFTISSVTDATHLTLTGSVTNSSPVKWTHAGTANVLKVASTSGWVAGDLLGIAPTSRTYTDAESATILTVDSSTQVTLTAALANQHSGDSPTQAEVIHLTRNVTVEGTSNSLQGYVFYAPKATVNDSYCEFKYLGSATTSKRGIDIQTTTGNFTAIGCSYHDFVSSQSCPFNIVTSCANISASYCRIYNCSSYAINLPTPITPSSISFSYITSINTLGFVLNTTQVTFTNIINAGSSGVGFTIGISTTQYITGTINNITSHASVGQGIVLTGIGVSSNPITNVNSWRNTGAGIQMVSLSSIILDTGYLFGNTTNNIFSSKNNKIHFKNFNIGSDIIFSTTSGIQAFDNTLYLSNCVFGQVSGIMTSHTTDLNTGNTIWVILKNTILASSSEIGIQSNIGSTSSISSQNHDQVIGSHKIYTRYCTITSDTVTYRTNSPAQTLTPNSATFKSKSVDTTPVVVDSGQTVTVTVYVYKSAAYNGAQPRLFVKTNYSVGITSETLLATASGGTGTWLTLSGTTVAATADGAMIFYVDCDGTAGTVTIDDWSIA